MDAMQVNALSYVMTVDRSGRSPGHRCPQLSSRTVCLAVFDKFTPVVNSDSRIYLAYFGIAPEVKKT